MKLRLTRLTAAAFAFAVVVATLVATNRRSPAVTSTSACKAASDGTSFLTEAPAVSLAARGCSSCASVGA